MHINLWQKACTHNFYILTFFLLTLIVDRNNEKVHSLSRKGVSSINDVQHLAQNGYMTYFSSSFYLLLRFSCSLTRIYAIYYYLHNNGKSFTAFREITVSYSVKNMNILENYLGLCTIKTK